MTAVLTSLGIAFHNAAYRQATASAPLTYANTWVARKVADMIDRKTASVPLNGCVNIVHDDAVHRARLRRMGFEI